ncbi:MAG: hypothetical protein WCI18_04660 [Pseudomonadota bacterium]
MLRRLLITMGLLLCLGVVFIVGKASYRKPEIAIENQGVSEPPETLVDAGAIESVNESLRSKLNPETQTFDDEPVTENVSGCDENPEFTSGNIRNFIKTLGILPRGLYPEEGNIEAFELYFDKGSKQMKLSLQGDESGSFKYKLIAVLQPEKDSEEPPTKIELAPESMVSLSKGEAIEAMKQEVAKFLSEGAKLGPRYLSLASEVKFDGDLHLARIDLVDNKIVRFQLNQKIACNANAEGLSCVCYPPADSE